MSDTSAAPTKAAKSTKRRSTAAKSSAATKPGPASGARRGSTADASSTARPETIGATAASRYLSAVLARTAEQAMEWDSAGRALTEEIRAVQNRASRQLPDDSYAQRLALAAPSDVATILQVHQGYIDEINRVAETLNAGYEKAGAAYAKKAQALWEESRERAADDFTDYVDGLGKELASATTGADPDALATIGAALIAMSQLAGAVPRR